MQNNAGPVIEVKNLSKHFGSQVVLDHISTEFKQGEVVSLIGPSGGGKSTFLRCLNRLAEPTEGDILFHGQSIMQKGTDINAVRQKMGMVFQHFHLFPHLTVLENMVLAPMELKKLPKDEARAMAVLLLKKVGLADKADSRVYHLSGGQMQRIAIVRALMMQPDVMLFDEPTSALDPEMIKEVLDVMRDVAKTGMTMLVVTHEMRFARDVSARTLFLAGGKIVEDAPSLELFSHPKDERLVSFLSAMDVR